jgi:hypothetical protein
MSAAGQSRRGGKGGGEGGKNQNFLHDVSPLF